MVAGAVGVCEGGDFNISSLPMLPTGAAHLPFLPTETQRRKKTKISKCSLCVRHCARSFYENHLNSFLESFRGGYFYSK